MNADGDNKAAGEALQVPESDAEKPKRGSRRERRRARRMVEPSLRKSCDMCHVQKRKCEGDGKGVCRYGLFSPKTATELFFILSIGFHFFSLALSLWVLCCARDETVHGPRRPNPLV